MATSGRNGRSVSPVFCQICSFSSAKIYEKYVNKKYIQYCFYKVGVVRLALHQLSERKKNRYKNINVIKLEYLLKMMKEKWNVCECLLLMR